MPKVWFQMVKPTVISTFAGCGGSSLGYKLAGFRELLAAEWDDNAVETFKLNFPGIPIYHGDIAKLSGAECMKLAGIKAGELDVLDGSPPCQGFSTAGKRKFDDPRNSLFKEFARLLKELQPRVFVMENVTGMVKGCMKQAYLVAIKTLRDYGYRAKGEVLNAMYFNVPQSRQRVIIIGVRNDLGVEPTFPKPQVRGISVQNAIGDLAGRDIKELMHVRHTRANDSKSFINWIKTKHGDPVLGQSLYKINPNKPSNTIKKSSELFHYSENRPLTAREYARLHSYPDGFKFISPASAHIRVGNSVPPNLMRAIAEHIRKGVLSKCPAK